MKPKLQIYNYILYLSETLNNRLTGTKQEKNGANFIEEEIKSDRLYYKVEKFKTPASPWEAFLFLYLNAFLITLFYNSFILSLKFSLIIISLLLTIIFYCESTFRRTPLFKILSVKNSQNIFVKLPSLNIPYKKIILSAHIDSAVASILFKPGLINHLKLSIRISLISFFLLTLNTALSLFYPLFIFKIIFLLLAIYYFFGIIITFHSAYLAKPTNGANDNASSVAILLYLVKFFAKNNLKNTEIIVLFTGAEEAGCVGIYEFLKKHKNEFNNKRDKFIVLDCTGIGIPVVITKEGMLKQYLLDKELIKICERVKSHLPFNIMFKELPLGYTEIEVIKNFGFNGITIGAAPPDPKEIPNWHQKSDVAFFIQKETLYNVFLLLREILYEYDKA